MTVRTGNLRNYRTRHTVQPVEIRDPDIGPIDICLMDGIRVRPYVRAGRWVWKHDTTEIRRLTR